MWFFLTHPTPLSLSFSLQLQRAQKQQFGIPLRIPKMEKEDCWLFGGRSSYREASTLPDKLYVVYKACEPTLSKTCFYFWHIKAYWAKFQGLWYKQNSNFNACLYGWVSVRNQKCLWKWSESFSKVQWIIQLFSSQLDNCKHIYF